jgi:hypothetical protein
MPRNFTKRIFYDGKSAFAAIIPEVRQDGVYYEVNIKGFPRFYMTWSALGRYDLVPSAGVQLPYNAILAVSDAIEEVEKKGR